MKNLAIFSLIIAVYMLFGCYSASAVTVLADRSYYPAIRTGLREAASQIKIDTSFMEVSTQNRNDQVLSLLRELQMAALRGVSVEIWAPVHDVPFQIIKKLTDRGIKWHAAKSNVNVTSVTIDDTVFIGSHVWTAGSLTQDRALTLRYSHGERPDFMRLWRVPGKIASFAEKAGRNIAMAVSDVSVLNNIYLQGIIESMKEKKETIKISVVLDQGSITSHSIEHLFSNSEKNIALGMDLYHNGIPVTIDAPEEYFSFQLFIIDDMVLLGIPAKPSLISKFTCKYLMLSSREISRDLLDYINSIPVFSIKEIVKYN